MTKSDKRTLSTYVEPDLAARVEREAREKRVSTSAVLRWAIMDRYRVIELEELESERKPVRS